MIIIWTHPNMPNRSLNTLQPGESAVILNVSAEETLHHRLSALGFRVGREIRLVRRGGFRGPLQLRIGTTEVIMRRADADKIRIAQP
jgi:ferrous iron transport protein A